MRPSVFQVTLIVAWLLAGQAIVAQEENSSAETEPSIATSGSETREQESSPESPSVEADSVISITVSPALESAINRLPADLQEVAPLTTLRRLAFAGTSQDRRPLLWEAAREISGRIATAMPQDQLEPLVNAAAQLAAQLYRESRPDQDWGTKALEVLSQLEFRLNKEFPTQLELAATVGLERLRITSIPQLGSDVNYYWKEGPIATAAFLQKYRQTSAAAHAAVLLANAYEVAQNSPAGLPFPAEGQFREPTRRWYHLAIEQAPDSLWGKLARGCLNRLDLVGQTLQVSGNSLGGKPLSLESFRGKPTVVVFFRPRKSSWGAVDTPGEFAAAVHARGLQILGVLCHPPTAMPEKIEDLPKEFTPSESEKLALFPIIEDTIDIDTSYSVRFGLTALRLFVLVDETGKVVRTQQTEIKNLDEFLERSKPAPVVSAIPAETSADQPTTTGTTEQNRQPESSTIAFPPPSLQTAVNQLPEAVRNTPAYSELLARLTVASRGSTDEVTTDEQRKHLQQQAKDAAALIIPTIPSELHLPLARQAARLLAQLHRDSHAVPDWQAKVLADLEQLETRLARDFPSRVELASQVGIERLWCRLYSVPADEQNESNPDSPQLTSEFIEQYPHTAAAAQAAYLAATHYERWAFAHLGPNYRPRDDVPEMDEDYFQQAVEQSPNSIWGKAAAGALRRIRLVGQTLQVSGRSLDGKFLSLKQFRGNQEVVVFFRPGKSSWGAVETPDDFADAVRRRGFDVLGVLCHLPTAAPDQIAEYVRPTSKDGPHMPLLVDTDDVDTSNSVRYGLTVQRLFVLVDATGKVVRTATNQVKDIDAFLGPPLDTPLAATAIQPENTAPAEPSAFSRDDDAPAGTTPARPFSQDAAAAPQPPVPAANSPLTMKIFHLQNGVAADYSKLLQDIFTGTKLTADPRTNAILAAGEEQELQKIEALLRALDESKTKPAAPDGSATATEIPKSKRRSLAFTATWCGPCQKILPILRSIAEQGAPIQFVDVDREPELAKRHQVTSIPAVIVEEDGREVERLVGIVSRLQLEKLILGRVVTSPDAPAPARSVAADTSDDPFAAPQGFSVPLPTPSRSQPPGLLALESRAAELAHKVRELSKTHGSAHPELIAARQQLEQTLTEALELKFQSEQRQVATLEQRLTRLKSQLDQRKAVRHEIVERRLRELLETPTTRWNTDEHSTDEYASDSNSRPSIPPQATEAASTNLQPAVQDQITVDLYATDGIYQNDKLIAAVVAPLNKLSRVVANVRMIPGDSGKFAFAIVHDPSQRMDREAQQTGQESATRQAISAALKAGEINNVRWEGAIDFVPAKDVLPTEREVAPGAAAAPSPITPPTRKPTDSLEASARLTLDLAEAEADIRETEAKLAIQVKLHARGVVAIDEVTGAMQRRDRAVRKRQILLDEYAATVKDLELQLSAASLENDLAESDHRRLIQLVEQKAVPLKEAQDAALRAVRSAHTLERLKNRLEFLKKSGEGSAVKEPSPSKPPADSQASPIEPTPDPQPVKN